nr:MAG TPA: hypothetical protein [Caudoviricetes sp.]
MTPGGLSLPDGPPPKSCPTLEILRGYISIWVLACPSPVSSHACFFAPFQARVGAGENSDRSIRKDAKWSKRRPKHLGLPRKLNEWLSLPQWISLPSKFLTAQQAIQ